MVNTHKLKLGLNIDHIATVREARGGAEPDLIQGALEGIKGGANSITIHLREDRRHIQDDDVFKLRKKISVPLNLEMSTAEDIVRIACRVRPAKACLVPEKRQELTTEGGLDVISSKRKIARVVNDLQEAGILVSLFIDPVPKQIRAAYDIRSDYIELHTGAYANARSKQKLRELQRLRVGATIATKLGLGVNAGHGLNYKNVKPITRLRGLYELNIGHAIVARAMTVGIRNAVREMCRLLGHA